MDILASTDLPWLHERDIEFMLDVATAPRDWLETMVRWQCYDRWKMAAVRREIARRDGLPMPHVNEE